MQALSWKCRTALGSALSLLTQGLLLMLAAAIQSTYCRYRKRKDGAGVVPASLCHILGIPSLGWKQDSSRLTSPRRFRTLVKSLRVLQEVINKKINQSGAP